MHSWTARKIVTTNYHILKGISKNALDSIKLEWELSKSNIKDNSHFKYITADEYQDYVIIHKEHKLHNIVKSEISLQYQSIMFLISNPRSGLGPVHIDAGRGCAINIPIDIDYNNTCFFIANQECTERAFLEGEPVNQGSKRFLYEPEKYDYYNVREPILLNTKKAHGFFNHSDKKRVLLSISFSESYENILSLMSHK